MRRFLKIVPLGLLVALLLSACTVTVRPAGVISTEFPLNSVIEEFRPTRGAGSTYNIGDRIEFLLVADRSGYVTLSAIDPDGSVYVFARNIPVQAGANYLPLESQRVVYNAGPPRGLHHVRASFTSGPTDTSVSYTGRRGDNEWSSAITLEIRASSVRDVSETTLYIR